jgi:hypothetical protein
MGSCNSKHTALHIQAPLHSGAREAGVKRTRAQKKYDRYLDAEPGRRAAHEYNNRRFEENIREREANDQQQRQRRNMEAREGIGKQEMDNERRHRNLPDVWQVD